MAKYCIEIDFNNIKKKIYVHFAFLFFLSVIVLSEKSSLQRRIQTLEQRQNILEIRVNTDNTLTNDEISSLHQDIDIVNVTLNSLSEKVCPDTTRNKERVKTKQTKVFTENAEIDSYRRFVSLGIAEEKKWLRDKVQTFANSINKQNDRIYRSVTEINDTLKESDKVTDTKFKAQTEETAKLQTKLLEMSETFSTEFSVIRNDTNQMLEEEKLKSMEMFQDLQLYKKLLKENQENTNKIIKRLNQAYLYGCPDDWIDHESFCYLFIDEEKIYADAREVCSSLGANVADIENKVENGFIFSIAEKKIHLDIDNLLWLGFTDEVIENVWKSDRTGTSAVYINLRSGQPDGGKGQQCMIMGYESPYDKWNDWPCGDSYKNRFVCKKSSRLIFDLS